MITWHDIGIKFKARYYWYYNLLILAPIYRMLFVLLYIHPARMVSTTPKPPWKRPRQAGSSIAARACSLSRKMNGSFIDMMSGPKATCLVQRILHTLTIWLVFEFIFFVKKSWRSHCYACDFLPCMWNQIFRQTIKDLVFDVLDNDGSPNNLQYMVIKHVHISIYCIWKQYGSHDSLQPELSAPGSEAVGYFLSGKRILIDPCHVFRNAVRFIRIIGNAPGCTVAIISPSITDGTAEAMLSALFFIWLISIWLLLWYMTKARMMSEIKSKTATANMNLAVVLIFLTFTLKCFSLSYCIVAIIRSSLAYIDEHRKDAFLYRQDQITAV